MQQILVINSGQEMIGFFKSNSRIICWWIMHHQVAQNTIDFITIATAGNAQDFGDLTSTRSELVVVASPTRGLFLVVVEYANKT